MATAISGNVVDVQTSQGQAAAAAQGSQNHHI
ncbi:hypothetical protein AZE42_10777 [Rhizopogon vesiculosus]|uniref:Uncharacterized protein n=1 Tax=Rhizopogon vesiculosus TaxID=180088 RepID=A0A1J8PZM2_9AGAM|nr:hypothetical protein AZE42_10777 [Rhizopogon vesiculosus]